MSRAVRASLPILLAAAAIPVAIACGGHGTSGHGGGGGGAGESGEHGDGQPTLFRGHQKVLDLLDLSHLADVDHHGLYVDFGTPARMKYTSGGWRTGWLDDRTVNGTTFTQVGVTGRIYFPVDQAGPITLRLRMKGVGTRNVTLYLNGHSIDPVRLAEGGDFADYDVHVAAENVLVGENHLLMRFGGSQHVGTQDVSIQLDSLRVILGESAPADGTSFSPPTWDGLHTEMQLGQSQRPALAVRAPTKLSYFVQVVRGAKLGFSVGGDADPAPHATARVVVTPEGGESAVLYTAGVGTHWHDELVSLDRWAGQVVRIDLEATGDSGTGRVGWASPAIYVPSRAAAPPPSRAHNVVLLLIDTMRADKLRPWNPRTRVRTPAIDRIAQDSVIFDNAQAPENWTKPSVASVLTSLWPMTHQAKTDAARVPASAQLVSETFKEAGISTASFIANGYVSDAFGFDQGWDHYTNFIRDNADSRAETVFKAAGDWVEAHKSERFFLYVQTIDPHVPYDPPDEYLRQYDDREYGGQVVPRSTAELLEKAKKNPPEVVFDASDQRRLEGLYDGEVAYHDHWLSEFIDRLDRLGLTRDTIFVVVADHGEEFHDHGSWGHGHSLYQELLHVPLMIRFPGRLHAGQRIAETVSTVDVAPTLLEAAGVPVNAQAEGHSLFPLMRGEVRALPEVSFSDFLDDRRSIRAGRWKLILRGINPTMFDLEADPGEQHELAPQARPIAMRYCRILLGQFLGARDRRIWLSAVQPTERSDALQQQDANIDPTLRQQLGGLGYAGGNDRHGDPALPCTVDADCASGQHCAGGHCAAAAPPPGGTNTNP